MYAAQDSMYPFPTLWPAMSRTEGLLQCLPPREQLFIYLESFSHKAQCFAFPYIPEELTIKEVEHFLKNVEENAEKVPDLLGLIFAALALGVQLGTFEGRRGSQTDTSQPDSKKGEVFCKLPISNPVFVSLLTCNSCCSNAGTSSFEFYKSSYFEEHPSYGHARSILDE
jgi:hypothetical protein